MKKIKIKKKYAIAIGAFVVCCLMFFGAIKVQRMYANKITDKQESYAQSQSGENAKHDQKSDKKTVDTSKNSSATAKSNSDNNKNKTGSNTSNSSNSGSQTSTQQTSSSETKVKASDPDEAYSIQFIDTVHGNNVFLKKNVNNMDEETVGYITCKLLDDSGIKYKATGSASTIYFASINGLEEKKAGKLSGWCYYVKKKGENAFHKPNVGSGQFIYHNGDIVVWKYLADGINDGYSDDWGK